ncbi:MAG: hypothetical protein WA842_02030 [Croceibacterium sp.]
MRPCLIVFLPLLLPLAACDAGTTPAAAPSKSGAAAPAVPVVAPLLPEQIATAELGGELGCAFATADLSGPLLVASGMVSDPEGTAQALAGGDGLALRMEAVERGGFDGMINGAEFAAKGFRYAVKLTGEPAPQGGESPPRPAQLTVTAPWGAQKVLPGEWTCGP